MGRLLEKASSPEVLNYAWKRCRNDKTVWAPGISRGEMESKIVFHLLKLSQEIQNGTYLPDPVRIFPVKKGDGKERIISAITLKDKIAQKAVLRTLEPIGERYFHPDSFGYRPGRTIDMALAKVREYVLCGLVWLIDADIENFFDSIPLKPLKKIIKSYIPDPDLIALIDRWLNVGAVRRGFLASTRGLPQGSVLSPFLCNLYLTEWDNAMSSRNLPFVRFADDFLVFLKSKKEAEKARTYVEKTLLKWGLALHPRKTRIVQCSPNVKFLGKKLPKIPGRQ